MLNLAYKEVRLWIGLLAKLGRFKSTVDNFLVYIITVSLASGPIQSLISWYAKVLHVYPRLGFVIQIHLIQSKFTVFHKQNQLEVLAQNLPVIQNHQHMNECLDHQLLSLVQHKDTHCQHSG
jgi:hypothetical protein